MFLQSIFSLTLVLDSDKFSKLFEQIYFDLESVDENMYADYSLTTKGVT